MARVEDSTNIAPLILRDRLKEAATLKKEKKYVEACQKLREAYTVDGAGTLTINDRLRLPMCLQLAGRADEGWEEMNRLNVTYVDLHSQICIAAHMAKFLRKERNYRDAVMFAVWELFKRKELDMDTLESIIRMADQESAQDAEWKAIGLSRWSVAMPTTGTTPNGNPIHDVSYAALLNRLNSAYGDEALFAVLGPDLVKIGAEECVSAIAIDMSHLFAQTPPYNLASVRNTLARHLK